MQLGRALPAHGLTLWRRAVVEQFTVVRMWDEAVLVVDILTGQGRRTVIDTTLGDVLLGITVTQDHTRSHYQFNDSRSSGLRRRLNHILYPKHFTYVPMMSIFKECQKMVYKM